MTHKARLSQLEKRTQSGRGAVNYPAGYYERGIQTFYDTVRDISLKLFGTAEIPNLSDDQIKEFGELVKEIQNEHSK